MAETKEFPTADVLSVITGVLVSERGADVFYEVSSWMADGPVWTHQLPRVGREARAAVLKLRPDLADAVAEADALTEVETATPDDWRAYAARWIERCGPTIAVPRMTDGEHERIDPLSELAEKVHPDRIVVAKAEGDHG
jgi:hypothetical protein